MATVGVSMVTVNTVTLRLMGTSSDRGRTDLTMDTMVCSDWDMEVSSVLDTETSLGLGTETSWDSEGTLVRALATDTCRSTADITTNDQCFLRKATTR